jgi:hypothetical protein
MDLDPIRIAKSRVGFVDYLERLCTGRLFERVVGFQNAVKREMVSNKKLGIDLPRLDCLSNMGVLEVSTNSYVV